MTDISKNSELQQSRITDVKSRFFAQYWGQEICQTKGGKYTIDEYCFPLWEKSYLELKPLSKIANEDAQEIQRITGANHLPKQPLIYACLKKSDAIPVVDYLRLKGYAIPFMEYSVDDLISFGWAQLL
jgi:hypothetical protein